MNLALGAKILWIIVIGKRVWQKEIMQKKYMDGTRKRCVDKINIDRKGLSVWELCKSVVHIISERMYWTPRNEKEIKIWFDKCGTTSPANLLQTFP